MPEKKWVKIASNGCKRTTNCSKKAKCSCKQQGITCGLKCHHGKRCCNAAKTKIETPILIAVKDDTNIEQQSNHWWLPQLQLSFADEKELIQGQWLTDRHITAAQSILKSQFPHVDGLVSPLIGTTSVGFNPVTSSAIQIHNNERIHWVTSSTSMESNSVNIYDSLFNDHLPVSLRRQLVDLYRLLADDEGSMTVNVKAVQQQRFGEGNCGPFTIAFATSLCHGIDPSSIAFQERYLRRHIHSAFLSERFDPFPESKSNVRRAVAVQIKISIHCICHQHLPLEKLAKCEGCDTLYHLKCVSKNTAGIKKQPQWYCQSCSERIRENS